MTDTDATRLSGSNSDATRFAGESYRTRLAPGVAPDDKTRIAQEGYQSKLARDAAKEPVDASEFYKIGDKIGDRYEVSAIHHGAMGVVYGCFDHQTKLTRALKTVRSRHLHDKQVLSLFENEAAVWISLEKHPYIVRAYLVERFNSLPYVITEYVRGPEGMEGDLRGWLGHPRLTLPVAVAMALQIAQGMQHAVRKVPNLVHRDLKPGNILVSGDGKAMVTDFGLVNSAEAGAGTPAYMSPEQWREDALDARSDIYAYGCILFEMFTAHRLFPALTERDWENAHLANMPAALTSLAPELPGEIDKFVWDCLEKIPGNRPQGWDEIVTFFAEWYHRLTGKAVVLDFSSLALDAAEWLSASYSLSNLKRWEEMLSACDCSLAIDQNDAGAWINKGVALKELSRYEEAIQAYDRALAIDQNHAVAWCNKGSVLSNLKRYEEAFESYDRALEIDPNYAAAWYNKGNALYGLKRYEEEIQAYDRALDIDSNYLNAWYNKGVTLSQLKRYEEAIQAYDRTLDIDPNYLSAWLNKGVALIELSRHDEAIESYDRALEIDPNYAAAWYNKGNALYGLKSYEDAIKAWDRSLTIDPNSLTAWYNKGSALYNLKRYEEAIAACDHALAINPNFAEAQNTRNDALRQLKLNATLPQTLDLAHAKDAVVSQAPKIESTFRPNQLPTQQKRFKGKLFAGIVAGAFFVAWLGGVFIGWAVNAFKNDHVSEMGRTSHQGTFDLASAKPVGAGDKLNVADAHKPSRSDSEIAEQLAKQSNYDLAGARKAGYTDQQIIKHLSPNQPDGTIGTKQGHVEHKGTPNVPIVPRLDPIGRAPNGQSWPAQSGYLRGYKKLNAGGLSSLTIDNTSNYSNVYLKLYALDQSPPVAARHVFIKAGDTFTFGSVRAGNYDVRYRDLRTGGISKSERFELREIREDGGTRYSKMTLTLYKIQNGNMKMRGISEDEF